MIAFADYSATGICSTLKVARRMPFYKARNINEVANSKTVEGRKREGCDSIIVTAHGRRSHRPSPSFQDIFLT